MTAMTTTTTEFAYDMMQNVDMLCEETLRPVFLTYFEEFNEKEKNMPFNLLFERVLQKLTENEVLAIFLCVGHFQIIKKIFPRFQIKSFLMELYGDDSDDADEDDVEDMNRMKKLIIKANKKLSQ
jgi:hypothetical protein